MATVPVPRTYVANELLDATILNGNGGPSAGLKFLLSPPRVSVSQSAGTSLTTGVQTLVPWDTEAWDIALSGTDAMHDNATLNSRLVAVTPGMYDVQACLTFLSNATGVRQLMIRRNSAGSAAGGTQVWLGSVGAVAINSNTVNASLDVQMAASDYLEVFAFQSSGGALALNVGPSVTYAQMRWVASS